MRIATVFLHGCLALSATGGCASDDAGSAPSAGKSACQEYCKAIAENGCATYEACDDNAHCDQWGSPPSTECDEAIRSSFDCMRFHQAPTCEFNDLCQGESGAASPACASE